MSFAIETQRLTKYYGPSRVVDSLDLRVPAGSVYGLLGRNGAGKTTVIKMLLGLVQPNYGRARLLGEDTRDMSSATRQKIAYLAEGHPLYPWMSVGEIVHFMRPFYASWNQRLVEQILEHFELPQRAKLRRLSNGQRAQVSLALAVASQPEQLILDDPTLGLDTVVRRDFLESMIQVIQSEGRTILFSSHILGDVERIADRIGILDDGVLRVDCPTDHFKQSLRKVIVRFSGDAPELPSCPGLVRAGRAGSSLELVLVGFDERHRAMLESLTPPPVSVDVLEMNLEDAFIEYTRRSNRRLPVFVEETSHVQVPCDERTA